MVLEKKPQKFTFIVLMTFVVLFLSLSFWWLVLANSPDNPVPDAAGINIGVCVDPPSPDVTDPSQPIFRWTPSGNPQVSYWLKVGDSPPVLVTITDYVYSWTGIFMPGWLSPRCACDIWGAFKECPNNFSATASDPGFCYDNYTWWDEFGGGGLVQESLVFIKVENSPPYSYYTFAAPVLDTGSITSSNAFHQTALGQLAGNKTYWYLAAIRDAFGWTPWTGGNSFFLPPTIPPPGDFTLSLGGSVACNSVPLSWTSSSNADGYRILKGAARVDISPYQPYTALNFTDTTVSQNTSYIYQIEAYNTAGTNRSNALNVDTPYCPPTLNFSANPTSIFQGQSSTLSWSTSYTTSCTASGAWSGSKAISGSQTVVPLPPPQVTYTLTCSGLGGSASASAIVDITPLLLPDWREIIPR